MTEAAGELGEVMPRQIDYHEAGHVLAVMRWTDEPTPRRVTIVPQGTTLGHLVMAIVPETERGKFGERQWRRLRLSDCLYFVAGLAAEHIANGRCTEAIAEWTDRAANYAPADLRDVLRQVIPPALEACSDDDIERAFSTIMSAYPSSPAPVDRMLRVYRFAHGFLVRQRDALDALAKELRARQTLDASSIDAVVRPRLR